jgi:hypothetical protein
VTPKVNPHPCLAVSRAKWVRLIRFGFGGSISRIGRVCSCRSVIMNSHTGTIVAQYRFIRIGLWIRTLEQHTLH